MTRFLTFIKMLQFRRPNVTDRPVTWKRGVHWILATGTQQENLERYHLQRTREVSIPRIINIVFGIVLDRLAHPVQGVVTCWMQDFTMLVSTVMNMLDKMLDRRVLL